jgi:hypothetical protein
MKTLLTFFLLINLSFFAQKTMNVDLTITYKGAPLCFWDVTLKHGDVAISKGKTDDQGNVKFSNVGLLSLSVDASGIKKSANGEKKWDVKGYIQLNDQGVGKFDFEPLVKDAGMPVSMLEAAWGLTLADCAKGNTSSSSSNSSASSPTKSESSTNSTQAPPKEEEKEESAADIAKSTAETLQSTKAMQESKVSNLTSKIAKKTTERSKYTTFTKEHSALSYEIKDLELDKEMTQVKLDKTNAMIAKGNMPLIKSERESFNQREDAIKESQSKLEQSKKAGILFDGVNYEAKKETIQTSPVSTPVNTSPSTEKKTETNESKEVKETKEESLKASETEAKPEKEKGIKLLNNSDLAAMSVINLKKLKLDQNSKIASRKLNLKAKSTMSPSQIEQYEKDIKVLEENIILLDIEITKRG